MSQTKELVDWHQEQRCQKAVEALGQNGFTAIYCRSREEAHNYIIRHSADSASVGFGGSRSIVDLGVQTVFEEQGKEILNHGTPGLDFEAKMAIMRRQLTCDLFLTGSNAVTLSGWLVNIDGNGNRVAALTFGPHRVIVVAGRNKLVDGDLAAAAVAAIRFSFANIAVILLFIAVQLYRSRLEELKLLRTFPEYRQHLADSLWFWKL